MCGRSPSLRCPQQNPPDAWTPASPDSSGCKSSYPFDMTTPIRVKHSSCDNTEPGRGISGGFDGKAGFHPIPNQRARLSRLVTRESITKLGPDAGLGGRLACVRPLIRHNANSCRPGLPAIVRKQGHSLLYPSPGNDHDLLPPPQWGRLINITFRCRACPNCGESFRT